MSDTQVEEFLEHFGVKGQKWGVRQTVSQSGKTVSYSRSPLQKTVIAGGAIAGSYAAQRFVAKSLKGNTAALPIMALAGGAAMIAGARYTRTLIDKKNPIPASELGGKHIGDKQLSSGEKGYLTYIGFSTLAATGMAIAAKKALS